MVYTSVGALIGYCVIIFAVVQVQQDFEIVKKTNQVEAVKIFEFMEKLFNKSKSLKFDSFEESDDNDPGIFLFRPQSTRSIFDPEIQSDDEIEFETGNQSRSVSTYTTNSNRPTLQRRPWLSAETGFRPWRLFDYDSRNRDQRSLRIKRHLTSSKRTKEAKDSDYDDIIDDEPRLNTIDPGEVNDSPIRMKKKLSIVKYGTLMEHESRNRNRNGTDENKETTGREEKKKNKDKDDGTNANDEKQASMKKKKNTTRAKQYRVRRAGGNNGEGNFVRRRREGSTKGMVVSNNTKIDSVPQNSLPRNSLKRHRWSNWMPRNTSVSPREIHNNEEDPDAQGSGEIFSLIRRRINRRFGDSLKLRIFCKLDPEFDGCKNRTDTGFTKKIKKKWRPTPSSTTTTSPTTTTATSTTKAPTTDKTTIYTSTSKFTETPTTEWTRTTTSIDDKWFTTPPPSSTTFIPTRPRPTTNRPPPDNTPAPSTTTTRQPTTSTTIPTTAKPTTMAPPSMPTQPPNETNPPPTTQPPPTTTIRPTVPTTTNPNTTTTTPPAPATTTLAPTTTPPAPATTTLAPTTTPPAPTTTTLAPTTTTLAPTTTSSRPITSNPDSLPTSPSSLSPGSTEPVTSRTDMPSSPSTQPISDAASTPLSIFG